MTIQIAVMLPDGLVHEIDRLVEGGAFASRSQAIRSGLEALVTEEAPRGRRALRGHDGPAARDRRGDGRRDPSGHRRDPPRAVGAVVVGRGDVWWGEAPDEKGRPFLVVSRDAVNETMQRVLVAPDDARQRPAERARPGPRRGTAGAVGCVLRTSGRFRRPCWSGGSARSVRGSTRSAGLPGRRSTVEGSVNRRRR